MIYALILAGGSGARLWPYSRVAKPKQFLNLTSELSMLQDAAARLVPLVPPERTFVATGREYVDLVATQLPYLPAANIIGEPSGRGTAPAIGLAAIHLAERDPAAIMAVVTADHLIQDPAGLRSAIVAATRLADAGWLVTLGIRPSNPDSGFGYIERGEFLGDAGGLAAYQVARFVEKPDRSTAAHFLRAGSFDWNSGMFIWRVDRIMAELHHSMPELYTGLKAIRTGLRAGDHSVLNDVWPKLPSQTIDYGVMEQASRVAVIPVDIGWSDIGGWQTFYNILPHDDHGNAVIGRHVSLDTAGSLVFGRDRVIATLGLSDVVIVDAEDALLICSRERAPDLKQLLKQLSDQGLEPYLAGVVGAEKAPT